jgi:hypothetical protein
METTDNNRLYNEVLRTFEFRSSVDKVKHIGGGYSREAYNYPKNGDYIFFPWDKEKEKFMVVNCGMHTFDVIDKILYDTVLCSFEYLNAIDNKKGLGGPYFREAYNFPIDGDIIFFPEYPNRTLIAMSCGMHTFDIGEYVNSD